MPVDYRRAFINGRESPVIGRSKVQVVCYFHATSVSPEAYDSRSGESGGGRAMFRTWGGESSFSPPRRSLGFGDAATASAETGAQLVVTAIVKEYWGCTAQFAGEPL